MVRSAEDGVAKVLRRVIEGAYDERFGHILEGTAVSKKPAEEVIPAPTPIRAVPTYVGDRCPDPKCGGRAIFQEGC